MGQGLHQRRQGGRGEQDRPQQLQLGRGDLTKGKEEAYNEEEDEGTVDITDFTQTFQNYLIGSKT